MKLLKKISVLLLTVAALSLGHGTAAEAADGSLMFSDPETKAGERVGVDLVVKADAAVGDVEVSIKYDTSMLEFVEGDGAENNGSGVTFKKSGNGSDTEVRTTLYFTALKEGETTISVESSTAYLYSDETLYLTNDSTSLVKIAEGDGNVQATTSSTEGVGVTVDGVEYTLTDSYERTDIPEGYEETMLTYAGAERKFLVNETDSIYLGYLVDAAGEGEFFLYDPDTASFAEYIEVVLSDTTSIILLKNTENISLPERYQEMEFTVNGKAFPAWQDMEKDGYYIVYAVNSNGTKSLYQYDELEGSYQRIEIEEEEEVAEPEKETDTSTLLGKLQSVVDQFFLFFLILGAAVVLVLVIVLIVVSVKLKHRNEELDDWYEEYGDDEENDTPKRSSGKAEGSVDEDGFMDEDFEDEYEDEYDDDQDDSDYEYDDEYDEVDEEDEDERDSDFDIDFIDL